MLSISKKGERQVKLTGRKMLHGRLGLGTPLGGSTVICAPEEGFFIWALWTLLKRSTPALDILYNNSSSGHLSAEKVHVLLAFLQGCLSLVWPQPLKNQRIWDQVRERGGLGGNVWSQSHGLCRCLCRCLWPHLIHETVAEGQSKKQNHGYWIYVGSGLPKGSGPLRSV